MLLDNLKDKRVLVTIALIAIVTVAIGYSLQQPFALYGYAKSVPIQIGYNEVQEYWVLSAVVDETTAFKLVLGKGATESTGADESVKTESEVGILINPIQPYSKTNLVAANINYEAQTTFVPNWQKVPAFDVNDAGWLTTAVYDLGVYKNNAEQTSQRIEVDYQKPKVVFLETPEGTVTVNNLGILPQGVEVPSGDLIVVYDPDGNRHVWNKADLIKMVDDWNEGRTYSLRNMFTFYSWEFVWDETVNRGWLPQDVQLVHVSDVEITGTNQGITLTYSGIAFAGSVSIYVPDDLADTVIVQLFDPTPVIVEVTPDPLPAIDEGKSVTFEVKVKNTGSEGTVSISVSSTAYSFSPLTETTKNMEAEETITFRFEAYALNVESNTDTTSEIFVQGRGGSDTYTLKGTILNVEGYTPVIPDGDDDGTPTPTSWWEQYWWVILIVAAIVVAVAVAIYMKRKS